MNEERALSALPSVGVRVAAFVAILVSGLAGGLIGYSLIDLQCDGDCGLAKGIGLMVGAVTAAIGMAIVAVLVMRAMGEWREIEDRSNAGHAAAMTNSAEELRRLAERLAYEAGTLALTGRRSLGVGQPALHDTKSTVTDPVTEFDRAAESLIVGELRRLRPDDGIVGEEGADVTGSSGIDWHLDPIDGTVNFVYDLPLWCTSVAAVDAQGSVAGAVYAPVLGEMFSAARGAGATLDGVTLAASQPTSLEMALVGTGFSYLPDRRRAQGARVAAMIPHVRDIRRYGSAALDLCLTACGRLDAYFEEHLNSWDIAAGILIAAEAGAVTSDLRGGAASTSGVVVAGAGIHAALLELIGATTVDADHPGPAVR